MWISESKWILVQVVITLLIALPVFLAMQKKGFPDLKWRIIVPLLIGFVVSVGLLEGLVRPQYVYVVKDGEHGGYRTFGSEISYIFSNGTKATCGRAPGGMVLVNDSKDTLALETIYYSDRELESEEGDWDYLVLLPPNSLHSMKDTWIQYLLKRAPSEIRVRESEGTKRKYELRKLDPGDWVNWYFYIGEVEYGQPKEGGEGAVYDGARLLFEGTFHKNAVAELLLRGVEDTPRPDDSTAINLK